MNDASSPEPRDRKKLPGTYRQLNEKFPQITAAHDQMSEAADAAGPLDARTQALVKVGMCVGAGLESALRSHVRRAMANGATRQEIEHAIMLGVTTCGFPRAAAAWAWANVQFDRDAAEEGKGEGGGR